VKLPVPLSVRQFPPDSVQFVIVSVLASGEKTPVAVTVFRRVGSVYEMVKLPPVTCEFEMLIGLEKQELLGKVPVPLSWKLPFVFESGLCMRFAVTVSTGPSLSEKLPR
jgi:hypothetical protein